MIKLQKDSKYVVSPRKNPGKLHAVKTEFRVAGITAGGYAAKNIIETGKKFGTQSADDGQEEAENRPQTLKRYIQDTGVIRMQNAVRRTKNGEGFAGSVKKEKAANVREKRVYQKRASDTRSAYTGDMRQAVTGSSIQREHMRKGRLPENREVLLRYCNIRQEKENRYGLKSREERVQRGVEADDSPEPWVCSQEEREHIRQKRQGADNGKKAKSDTSGRNAQNIGKRENSGKKEKKKEGNRDKEKKKIQHDWAKQQMIMNYMLNEMTHEEGRADPNSYQRLIAQIAGYDVRRAGGWIAKKIRKAMKKVFIALLPVILSVCLVAAPVAAVFFYLNSPTSYISGIHELDETVRENPKYLKNIVQEMCRDFGGDIDFFLHLNGLNEVRYEYGSYPDANGITAAYLVKLYASDGYDGLVEEGAEGYPSWLFVDTEEERMLLQSVFAQFNRTRTEEIRFTVTNEDGEEEIVRATRMTVTCLTADKWKQEYGAELTGEAAEQFEELLAGMAGADAGAGAGGSFVAGNAVPIEDLVIPPGVDENLIYMAGFLRAEAGNQPERGKTAVAYVILNRAGGPSGNIKGVLTAPYQFSCYIPYHTVEHYLSAYAAMSQEERDADPCYRAAAGAYYGTSENPIGGMKYYCNPKYCSAGEEGQWARIRARNTNEEIIIISDHVFCKNGW